jgi:pSer/pThr/pTyr-binding forkhead associated (FHA) protein
MAKLTFVLEDGQEIVVPLAERITLGRADDNDVVVDDERISKRHAELVRNADGSVQVFDSNSTAGTFVNGDRVTTLTVRHGDKLAFGPLEAVLDLEEAAVNGSATVVAATEEAPAKSGKIATRKKAKGSRRNGGTTDKPAAIPSDEVLTRQQAKLQEESARLEEEKARLQAEEEVQRRQAALREESARVDEKARLQAEDEVQRRQAALREESARLQDEKVRLQDEKARLQAEEETQRRQAAIREEAARLEAAKACLKIEEEAQHRQVALREELARLEEKVRLQAEEEIQRRQGALQEESARLEAEKVRLQAEEEMLRRQAELREESARLEAEKAKLLTEMAAAQKEFIAWQSGAEKERNTLNGRVETLRKAEERLVPMQAAVLQAEAVHVEWIKAIKDLAVQHEEKTSTLQRLTSQVEQKTADIQQLNEDEAAIRREIESVVGRRDQAVAQLQQVREECTRDEGVLNGLRRQLAELEQRCQEKNELAVAREDQVKTAEKKLEAFSQRRVQLETHIKELTSTEERLEQIVASNSGAETRQAELAAAIAILVQEHQRADAAAKDLEYRIGTLQGYHQQIAVAVEEARVMQQRTEASLQHVREELVAREKEVTTCKEQIVAETKRLEETQARRAEIERQCQELAGTEQKLVEAKEQLSAAEKQHADMQSAFAEREAQMKGSIAEHEARITALKSSVQQLEGEDAAAEGRLEVLRAREKDLRGELARLGTAERAERTRFEEVRQLTAEAEKSHAAQKQQLTASLDETRRSLAELVSRLTPLREWKDAMDQLYARLATLPQDSSEARTLWHEIEKEKTGLFDLITTARSQARGGAAEPSHQTAPESPAAPPKAEKLPGTGTGSVMLPGAAQETTLRGRLTALRESVQREETRLEQLRLERTRQESHGRANPAADSVMREQSRQLENKIRQDEERYLALTRNLEASQVEEEKRRERLADMERKLAELRADVTEAERQRSELRQQTDLVQTELKNREAALDRILKKAAETFAQA